MIRSKDLEEEIVMNLPDNHQDLIEWLDYELQRTIDNRRYRPSWSVILSALLVIVCHIDNRENNRNMTSLKPYNLP